MNDFPDWLSNFCCVDDTHFFFANAAVCAGGTLASTPQVFPNVPNPYAPPGYNPYRQYSQPAAEPEIPAHVKVKAIEAGASHSSADGSLIYMLRLGQWCKAKWLAEQGIYGSWWACGELPAGAVKL